MQAITVSYRDPLERPNENVPLHEKVRSVHRVLQERLGDIDRIAAALYDPTTDLLKTFVHSSGGDDTVPPCGHTARLLHQGYAASYTMPMYHAGAFFGFLFFASSRKGRFTPEALHPWTSSATCWRWWSATTCRGCGRWPAPSRPPGT